MTLLLLAAALALALPTPAALQAAPVETGALRCERALQAVLTGGSDAYAIDDAALCLALTRGRAGAADELFQALPPARAALGRGLAAAYRLRDERALPALASAYAAEPGASLAGAALFGVVGGSGNAVGLEAPARAIVAKDPFLLVRLTDRRRLLEASGQLLVLLERIPTRWPRGAPRIPRSGQAPRAAIERLLPKGVTDAKTLLDRGVVGADAMAALWDLPQRERAAHIDAAIGAGELTEAHLWFAAYSSIGGGTLMSLPGQGAMGTSVLLQTAEAAGRSDLLFWGAALAAEDLVRALPDADRLDAPLDGWLALPEGPGEDAPRALLHMHRALRRNAKGDHAGALADFESAERLSRRSRYEMGTVMAGLGTIVTRSALGELEAGLADAFRAGDDAARLKARMDAAVTNPGAVVQNQLEDVVGAGLALRWVAAYNALWDDRPAPPATPEVTTRMLREGVRGLMFGGGDTGVEALRQWRALPAQERQASADVAALLLQTALPQLVADGRTEEALELSDALHAPRLLRGTGTRPTESTSRTIYTDPELETLIPQATDAEARAAWLAEMALAEHADPTVATAVRLQAVVDAAGPVVEYFVARDQTVAFVLRPGAPLETRTIPLGHAALRAKADRLRLAAANPGLRIPGELESAASELGGDLLGPLADLLPPSGTLTIVPHGPLHLVPFALLQLPGGAVAHERWQLAQASSVAALGAVRRRPERRAARRVTVAIHPDIDFPPLGLRGVRSVRLDPRPVAAAAASSRALVLASVGGVEHGDVSRAWLTTASGGRWRATEIATTELDLALVVLPVCNSGGGETTASDDRFNLVQAFTTAGADAVAATLWQIPDTDANARFVEAFLGAWSQGLRRDEALERARRAAIAAGAGPEVWAAWVLMGDAG